MSGVRMRVLFDDAPLRAHLARMALYNAAKFGALLRDVGEDMVGDVHDNIRAQRLGVAGINEPLCLALG